MSVETTAGWVKYPGNPVLGGTLGTCFDVSLLKENGRFRMWFSWRPRKSLALVESPDGIHCYNGRRGGVEQIGQAIHPGRDLWHGASGRAGGGA